MRGALKIQKGWWRLWVVASVAWTLGAGGYWQGRLNRASRRFDEALFNFTAQNLPLPHPNTARGERYRSARADMFGKWAEFRAATRTKAATWVLLPPIALFGLLIGATWVRAGFRADAARKLESALANGRRVVATRFGDDPGQSD